MKAKFAQTTPSHTTLVFQISQSESIIDMKNTWHHTCEKCYKQDSSVSMIYDPFEYDINNREVVLATLCSDCFSEDYALQQELHNLAMEV